MDQADSIIGLYNPDKGRTYIRTIKERNMSTKQVEVKVDQYTSNRLTIYSGLSKDEAVALLKGLEGVLDPRRYGSEMYGPVFADLDPRYNLAWVTEQIRKRLPIPEQPVWARSPYTSRLSDLYLGAWTPLPWTIQDGAKLVKLPNGKRFEIEVDHDGLHIQGLDGIESVSLNGKTSVVIKPAR